MQPWDNTLHLNVPSCIWIIENNCREDISVWVYIMTVLLDSPCPRVVFESSTFSYSGCHNGIMLCFTLHRSLTTAWASSCTGVECDAGYSGTVTYTAPADVGGLIVIGGCGVCRQPLSPLLQRKLICSIRVYAQFLKLYDLGSVADLVDSVAYLVGTVAYLVASVAYLVDSVAD